MADCRFSRLEGKQGKQPRLFIDLLILDVINRFIFGHGILIYYMYVLDTKIKTFYREVAKIIE